MSTVTLKTPRTFSQRMTTPASDELIYWAAWASPPETTPDPISIARKKASLKQLLGLATSQEFIVEWSDSTRGGNP